MVASGILIVCLFPGVGQEDIYKAGAAKGFAEGVALADPRLPLPLLLQPSPGATTPMCTSQII